MNDDNPAIQLSDALIEYLVAEYGNVKDEAIPAVNRFMANSYTSEMHDRSLEEIAKEIDSTQWYWR